MRALRPLRLAALAVVPVLASVLLLTPVASAAPAAQSAPVAAAAPAAGLPLAPEQVTFGVCPQPGYATGRFTITLNVTITIQGGQIRVFICGAISFAQLRGTVFSNPLDLGTVVADENGNADLTVDTTTLEPGPHTVVVTGEDGYFQRADFTVLPVGSTAGGAAGGAAGGGSIVAVGAGSSASSRGGLAFTGSNAIIPLAAIGVVLVLGGIGGVLLGRRRRGEAA